MNNGLIRKQEALDALMAERKYLFDNGQLGAEHILAYYGYNVIDRLPTQEIIHCKDCVYHSWILVDGPYALAQEIHWCDKLYNGEGQNLTVLSNDFCSLAERKKVKQNDSEIN